MYQKSFRPCIFNVLPIFVFCLFFTAPIYAQQKNSPKSLEVLFEDFKRVNKSTLCPQTAEALQVGKEIIERFNDDTLNKEIIEWVKKQIPQFAARDKDCKDENSMPVLLQNFKIAAKLTCGQRNKAIGIGKRILDLYGEDPAQFEPTEIVRKQIAKIEEEDRICRRNYLYGQSYKYKNWPVFFRISKEIIAEEGDSPFALDVMLTLVSVGFHRTAYAKNDIDNDDTVEFAQRALELIDSGIQSKKNWGVFEPFETKEKALGWLNYMLGYVSYFRLNKKDKAIDYFYKATTYNTEFKYDAFLYQAVAIYYFDKQAVTASNMTIREFIAKANIIAVQQPGGTNYLTESAAEQNQIATLYKKLVDLYNLRYNLADDENVNSLEDYIQNLISRPLIDPATKVKTVLK